MTKTSLDKGKIKILLLEGVHSSAAEAFRRDGYTNIEEHPKSLPEAKLATALRDAYIIGIRSATAHLTAQILASAHADLIGVGCFCIGTNQSRSRCGHRTATASQYLTLLSRTRAA